MTGGSKNGAASVAAPAASSRRVVGTIAEAAAIARAGARHETATPNPRESARRDRRVARIIEREATQDSGPAERDRPAHDEGAAEPAPRRTRAVNPAEVQAADSTVAHHILAERAYAYGRSIVEAGPEPKKPGEMLEIES